MATTYTITTPRIKVGDKAGPASYSTGGFELDLTADLSMLHFLKLEVETPGSLPVGILVVEKNVNGSGAFAPGKARISVLRCRYDKASLGAPSGNPAGTTVQASKFAAATTTGSTHAHAIDHDHPSATSSTNVNAGGASQVNAGGGNMSSHTHAVDVASFTGNSDTSGSHTHDRSFEYEHDHGLTNTTTDSAMAELAAATNISTTTFRYFAVGQ